MFITQNNENSAENTNLVIVQDNEAVTTSLKVAEVFEKLHKNVLQAIESLECSEKFRELNFQPSYYKSEQNKNMPMYYVTKKGFIMLGMGFTGKQAIVFKEAYIDAFEVMEKKLQEFQLQKNQQYQLMPVDIQKIFAEIDALKNQIAKSIKDNKGVQERLFHLENIAENRTYIPYKTAQPLSKFYVYFAFNPDNGLTKIGRSQEPETRLKAFKAISPNVDMVLVINVRDVKTSCELESFFHALFAPKHESGEIFNLLDVDYKLLEFLKDGIEAFN